MHTLKAGRRGFTIVEIITALVIIAIIGLAMTKLVLGQTRSFQFDNGGRRARAAARSAMNILITDLRMTQDNGGVSAVDATNNRFVTVQVPTVFGFVCELTGSGIVAALVATDSFQLATSKYGGYAVRDSVTGIYSYSVATSSDTIQSAGPGRCHGGGVNQYADTATIAGRRGGVYVMTPAPPGITAVGSPMFVWQTVKYEFATSTIYPGRLGLYRTVSGRGGSDRTTDELIAPFASSARFYYYTMNPYGNPSDSAVTTPPGNLNNLRGFRIFLPAESSDTMPTRNTPQSATVSTAVFFKNTRFP
jgi:prepilin-type N-terminal cleavage/methylation domain-containing protein